MYPSSHVRAGCCVVRGPVFQIIHHLSKCGEVLTTSCKGWLFWCVRDDSYSNLGIDECPLVLCIGQL